LLRSVIAAPYTKKHKSMVQRASSLSHGEYLSPHNARRATSLRCAALRSRPCFARL
jgi:hypothetical protein